MDFIHIDKLIFKGKHGVYKRERNAEQDFEVSVKLQIDALKARKSDKLEDTVDYDEVKSIIQRVIEGNSRYLMEKLADEIAENTLKLAKVRQVEVTIRKMKVWKNGVPGVTIVRLR